MTDTVTLTEKEQLPEQQQSSSAKHRYKRKLTDEQLKLPRYKNLKPWKKGQSGNPKGRPTAKHVFSDCVREAAKKKARGSKLTNMQLVVEAVYRKAQAGNIEAAKLLVERTEGKSPENINIRGTMGTVSVEYNQLLEIVKDEPERARQLASIIRSSVNNSTGS